MMLSPKWTEVWWYLFLKECDYHQSSRKYILCKTDSVSGDYRHRVRGRGFDRRPAQDKCPDNSHHVLLLVHCYADNLCLLLHKTQYKYMNTWSFNYFSIRLKCFILVNMMWKWPISNMVMKILYKYCYKYCYSSSDKHIFRIPAVLWEHQWTTKLR